MRGAGSGEPPASLLTECEHFPIYGSAPVEAFEARLSISPEEGGGGARGTPPSFVFLSARCRQMPFFASSPPLPLFAGARESERLPEICPPLTLQFFSPPPFKRWLVPASPALLQHSPFQCVQSWRAPKQMLPLPLQGKVRGNGYYTRD